jgi:hypothetical protein
MEKVLKFPSRRVRRAKAVRTADGFKYFNEAQIGLLRRTACDRARLAQRCSWL